MAGSYRCDHVEIIKFLDEVMMLWIADAPLRCETTTVGYRSCGCAGCKVEVGYCKEHGGDETAISVIQSHMREVHGKEIPDV